MTGKQKDNLIGRALKMMGTTPKEINYAVKTCGPLQDDRLVKATFDGPLGMYDTVTLFRPLKGGGIDDSAGYTVNVDRGKGAVTASFINHLLKL